MSYFCILWKENLKRLFHRTQFHPKHLYIHILLLNIYLIFYYTNKSILINGIIVLHNVYWLDEGRVRCISIEVHRESQKHRTCKFLNFIDAPYINKLKWKDSIIFLKLKFYKSHVFGTLSTDDDIHFSNDIYLYMLLGLLIGIFTNWNNGEYPDSKISRESRIWAIRNFDITICTTSSNSNNKYTPFNKGLFVILYNKDSTLSLLGQFGFLTFSKSWISFEFHQEVGFI